MGTSAQPGTIRVHQAMSTAVRISNTLAPDKDEAGQQSAEIEKQADILVAETIGTLLLSESQLDYIEDARSRLLKPGGKIIPSAGKLYALCFRFSL